MPRLFRPCALLLSLSALFVGCHSHHHHGDDAHAHDTHAMERQARLDAGTYAEPAFSAGHYQHIIDTLCAPEMEGRDAGTKGIELARDYLLERFQRIGLQPAFIVDGEPSYAQPLTIPTGRDENGQTIQSAIQNVGGLLPGHGDLADEVVIIGAHYDHIGYGHYGSRDPNGHGHIHPGADDNASGTAGVVLLAELFTEFAQEAADKDIPRRTILFTCFAGEERGLLGSFYMTRHPEQWNFDHEKVNGMINMDMIGRLRGGELYGFAHETGEQWRPWIEAANQEVGLDIKLDVRAPGGSDHTPFIMTGIPAVFFNTWMHEDVHTPNDTPDKINAEGSIQVLTLVADVLHTAMTNPERMTYVAPQRRPRRAYLGVRLASSEAGVVIEQVVEGASMQEAGGQDGDVLLSVNGEAVETARDIRTFLSQAKIGDEIAVQVKRGEEIVDLTVKLGGR